MDMFADKPIALPEGVDMENHVVATYWVQSDKSLDMAVMGQILAIEQSTGTWVPVPGETPEVRAKHVAKVIGVFESPYYEYGLPADIKERQYVIQIAFPSANVEDQLPRHLTGKHHHDGDGQVRDGIGVSPGGIDDRDAVGDGS